jgi:hypothetical protein
MDKVAIAYVIATAVTATIACPLSLGHTAHPRATAAGPNWNKR